MPSRITRTMNHLVRAELTAAEINAANRGFCAFSLERLSGQKALIWGLDWSVNVQLADRPNCRLVMFLQRGLIVTLQNSFPAEENNDQMIFKHVHDIDTGPTVPWFPARALPLEPGDSYALVLEISPLAAFASGATLLMTVYGSMEAVSIGGDDVSL